MSSIKNPALDKEFGNDVYTGLTASQKFLSSAYFYDETGDALFQKIMDLPEYYLTRSEYEIFEKQKSEIISLFADPQGFDLFELGAGDGKKTKILLKALLESKADFTYRPIDISKNALDGLTEKLYTELPSLDISPLQGTYFGVLDQMSNFTERKKVILFLGSNIGNLPPATAISFLQKIRASMQKQDLLFAGFDQKKDPTIILNAYHDSQGVTAAFNRNILNRINRELGANFKVETFIHWPLYNPQSGEAKSYLISREDQEVFIEKIGLRVNFRKWESIHTEISRKFDDDGIREMAEDSGLKVAGWICDSRDYYRDYYFRKL